MENDSLVSLASAIADKFFPYNGVAFESMDALNATKFSNRQLKDDVQAALVEACGKKNAS